MWTVKPRDTDRLCTYVCVCVCVCVFDDSRATWHARMSTSVHQTEKSQVCNQIIYNVCSYSLYLIRIWNLLPANPPTYKCRLLPLLTLDDDVGDSPLLDAQQTPHTLSSSHSRERWKFICSFCTANHIESHEFRICSERKCWFSYYSRFTLFVQLVSLEKVGCLLNAMQPSVCENSFSGQCWMLLNNDNFGVWGNRVGEKLPDSAVVANRRPIILL